jgi:predicted site-specific integrase-resolvase
MKGLLVSIVEKHYDVALADAAGRLGLTVDTLRRWARMSKVPARQNLSGRWMFNADDLAHIGAKASVVTEHVDAG